MVERLNKADYEKNFARLYPVLRLATTAFRRLHVDGTENLPKDSAMVIASNHGSVFDPLFLALAYYGSVEKPIRFLAKSGYFEGKGLDDKGRFGKAVKTLVTTTGQIPVDRGGRSGGDPLKRAKSALLDDGHTVAVFPEGTLVPYDMQAKFWDGAAHIALATGVPLVPAAVTPERDAYGKPNDGWLSKVHVRFGEPVYEGRDLNGKKFRLNNSEIAKLTGELAVAVNKLTGYRNMTDEYAVPGALRRQKGRTGK